LLSNTKYYIFYTIIFVVFAVVISYTNSRLDVAIYINSQNSVFFDYFFKYSTYLGHGLIIGILALYLIFTNKKYFYITVFSSLLTTLIVRFLKIYVNAPRPISYFKSVCPTDYDFHFVEGVKIASQHSFPSGHTATAFLFFFLLSFFYAQKRYFLQFVFFFLALIVAYSRLYLFQHFFIDVAVGALIGVISAIISVFFVSKILKNIKENGFIKIH
jgi:membrane-associated phospholipid phosphatase